MSRSQTNSREPSQYMPTQMEILRWRSQQKCLPYQVCVHPDQVARATLFDQPSKDHQTQATLLPMVFGAHVFHAPRYVTWTRFWRAWSCSDKKSPMGKISKQFTMNGMSRGHAWH